MSSNSGTTKPPTKVKRSACEGCYRSRVKCEFASAEATQCNRCKRQNRDCIPRTIVKSRRGTDSQLSKSIALLAGESPNLGALDLEAYKSSKIFDDLPQLGLHLSAASSLVKTYKSLGLTKPPKSLQWTINSMYLIAVTEKSLGLLHTSTTLAVSTNTPIDSLMIKDTHRPLTEQQQQSIEKEVHENFLIKEKMGACFILRQDGGDRALLANTRWEFFFENAKQMASRLSRSPHFKLWRNFLVNQHDAEIFTSNMIKTWLKAGEPMGEPPCITWTTNHEKQVEVQDNEKNKYTATMVEHGIIAGEGFFAWLVFGFKDIKPLTAAGEARVKEFNRLYPSNLVRKPSLLRLDSVLSMLLPEPGTSGSLNSKGSFSFNTKGNLTLNPKGSFSSKYGNSSMGMSQQWNLDVQNKLGTLSEKDEEKNYGGNIAVPPKRQHVLRHSVSSDSEPFPIRPGSVYSLLNKSFRSNGKNTSVSTGSNKNEAQTNQKPFEWPDSGLVKLDSDELWNNMDRVINDLGGSDKVTKEWAP